MKNSQKENIATEIASRFPAYDAKKLPKTRNTERRTPTNFLIITPPINKNKSQQNIYLINTQYERYLTFNAKNTPLFQKAEISLDP